MNVKNVRLINKEESDEIDRLSNEALKLLNLSDESNIIDILNKMNIFVDNFIENNDTNDNNIEDYAYKLGSLFGNLINAKYEWQWYYIENEKDIFYGVVSQKQRACCICHNYFYEILTQKRSNNFKLLFNMIEKEYPKNWYFVLLK
jgi:hypothetical protein